MELGIKEYMTFSQLVYYDFTVEEIENNTTVDHLMRARSKYFKGCFAEQFSSTLALWKLTQICDDKEVTGLRGALFVHEGTKAKLFAFRGTEKMRDGIHFFPQDYIMDIKIVLSKLSKSENSQFRAAYEFVKNEIQNSEKTPVYLTGHSLGGAISHYISIQLNIPATTFNSVGIGQYLGVENSEQYKIVDYVNSDDLIGNIGNKLGRTIYVEGNLSENIEDYHRVYGLLKNLLDWLTHHGLGSLLFKEIFYPHKDEKVLQDTLFKQIFGLQAHNICKMLTSCDKAGWKMNELTEESNVKNIADLLIQTINKWEDEESESKIVHLLDNIQKYCTTINEWEDKLEKLIHL